MNIILKLFDMRAKLLKRLRHDAHRNYGIKGYYHTAEGGDVYIVGLRGLQGKTDVASFSLENANKELHKMRSEFCMGRLRKLRAGKFYLI